MAADAHDMSPAAFSFAQLQAQPNGKPAGSATGLRQTDARAGSPPGMPAGVHLGASAASFTAHAGILHPPISAQAAYLQATVQAQRIATGAAAAASSSPATASALHTSGSSRQGPKQALRFEDDALAGRQPQAGSSSVDSGGLRHDQWHEAAGSSMEHHQAQMQASSHAGHYALPPLPIDPSHSPSTTAPRQHTDSSQGMDASTSHTVPHGLKVTQAFVTSKASPALVALLGDAVSAGVVQGLHYGQSSLGGRAYMRRALDEADGDISYKRFAATATASAAEAVAAYEASKKARAAEVASMRRSLAESRDAIDVKHKAALASSQKGGSGAAAGASFSGATGLLGATITSVTSVNGRSRPGSSHGASAPHVKDLANRLSGWLLNDVDRALAGQPMNCDVPPSSHGRRTQTTRLMAPLNSVRKLEASIHGALSGEQGCRLPVGNNFIGCMLAPSTWLQSLGANDSAETWRLGRAALSQPVLACSSLWART